MSSFAVRVFRRALLNLVLTFAACAHTNLANNNFSLPRRAVILISVDGLRPDAIAKAKTPILGRLIREGVYNDHAKAVMPSVTLVNHASMLSGVVPDKHKVWWNSYIPLYKTIEVPTIFDLAKIQNLSTALIAGKEKFKHFLRPATVDFNSILPTATPSEVADEFKRLSILLKPTLTFIHFSHPDLAGHEFGWMSPQQISAIELCDAAIGAILESLALQYPPDSYTLIISADHGGHDFDHGTADLRDLNIPWMAWGSGVKPGYSIRSTISTVDTAATVAALLGIDVPSSWAWDGRAVGLGR